MYISTQITVKLTPNTNLYWILQDINEEKNLLNFDAVFFFLSSFFFHSKHSFVKHQFIYLLYLRKTVNLFGSVFDFYLFIFQKQKSVIIDEGSDNVESGVESSDKITSKQWFFFCLAERYCEAF